MNRIAISVKSSDLISAAKILRQGQIVIFPTDTVYGIGCSYHNKNAIDRLRKIKGAPQKQPFPILVSSLSEVKKIAKITPGAHKLIKKYWPGALTIIMPSLKGKSSVGIRMPDYNLVNKLLQLVGTPLVATSANFHGEKSPLDYNDLDPEIIKLADYLLIGDCRYKVESTVVDSTIDPPKIIRLGQVKLK